MSPCIKAHKCCSVFMFFNESYHSLLLGSVWALNISWLTQPADGCLKLYGTDSDGHKCTDSDGQKCTDSDGHECTDSDGHKCTSNDGHKCTGNDRHKRTYHCCPQP